MTLISKLNPKNFLGAKLNQTKVVSTKVDEIIEKVNEITPAYKEYVALLSQSDTAAPTETVLSNTFDGEIVWTRYGVGRYRGTLTGSFPIDKTVYFINNSYAESNMNIFASLINNDYIDIFVVNNSIEYADSVLDKVPILIRVYN